MKGIYYYPVALKRVLTVLSAKGLKTVIVILMAHLCYVKAVMDSGTCISHINVIVGAYIQRRFVFICHKELFNSLTTTKADDRIFVCKFSKNVKSKLHYIENSKIRGHTEWI